MNLRDLYAALCLVLVIEGLLLFAVPRHGQAMMRQAQALSPRAMRYMGGVAVVLGLAVLQRVH